MEQRNQHILSGCKIFLHWFWIGLVKGLLLIGLLLFSISLEQISAYFPLKNLHIDLLKVPGEL